MGPPCRCHGADHPGRQEGAGPETADPAFITAELRYRTQAGLCRYRGDSGAAHQWVGFALRFFPPRGHSSAGSLVWQSQGHEEGLQFEVLERGEMSRSAYFETLDFNSISL